MKIILKQELAGRIFLIFFSFLFSSVAVYSIIKGKTSLSTNIVMCLFAIVFIILLANYLITSIIIEDSRITYKNLYGSKTMNFAEVTRVESKARIDSINLHGVHAKYTTTLFSSSGKIEIPIKSFSRKDLAELALILMIRCTKAMIDDTTQQMAQGKMPSAFFKNKK